MRKKNSLFNQNEQETKETISENQIHYCNQGCNQNNFHDQKDFPKQTKSSVRHSRFRLARMIICNHRFRWMITRFHNGKYGNLKGRMRKKQWNSYRIDN